MESVRCIADAILASMRETIPQGWTKFRDKVSYQPPYVLTFFAHSRVAIDRMVSGIPARAFQASQ